MNNLGALKYYLIQQVRLWDTGELPVNAPAVLRDSRIQFYANAGHNTPRVLFRISKSHLGGFEGGYEDFGYDYLFGLILDYISLCMWGEKEESALQPMPGNVSEASGFKAALFKFPVHLRSMPIWYMGEARANQVYHICDNQGCALVDHRDYHYYNPHKQVFAPRHLLGKRVEYREQTDKVMLAYMPKLYHLEFTDTVDVRYVGDDLFVEWAMFGRVNYSEAGVMVMTNNA